jgi:hypothetical protein
VVKIRAPERVVGTITSYQAVPPVARWLAQEVLAGSLRAPAATIV